MHPQTVSFEVKIKELTKCFPNPTPLTHAEKETPQGIQAIKDGENILKQGNFTYPDMNLLKSQLNGFEGFIILFGCHYRRLFSDPKMVILFNKNLQDVNVNAYEHGKRLASAIYSRLTGENAYSKLKRGSLFKNLQESHQRAKKCPFRSEKHKGKGFTILQRNSWLGHVWASCAEMGLSKKLQEQICHHLGGVIDLYSPFEEQ